MPNQTREVWKSAKPYERGTLVVVSENARLQFLLEFTRQFQKQTFSFEDEEITKVYFDAVLGYFVDDEIGRLGDPCISKNGSKARSDCSALAFKVSLRCLRLVDACIEITSADHGDR